MCNNPEYAFMAEHVHDGDTVKLVEYLHDGDMTLVEMANAYCFSAGNEAALVPCIVCEGPMGESAFSMYFLVLSDRCPTGGPHLFGTAICRHIDCVEPDIDDLARGIVSKIMACFSKRAG